MFCDICEIHIVVFCVRVSPRTDWLEFENEALGLKEEVRRRFHEFSGGRPESSSMLWLTLESRWWHCHEHGIHTTRSAYRSDKDNWATPISIQTYESTSFSYGPDDRCAFHTVCHSPKPWSLNNILGRTGYLVDLFTPNDPVSWFSRLLAALRIVSTVNILSCCLIINYVS